MPPTILDASAVVAYLKEEPGAELVGKVLEEAVISSVNWAEVIQSVASAGVSRGDLRRALPMVEIAPFLEAHAAVAGELRPHTRSRGLSLADRACLATAMLRDGAVLTSDRAWEGLDLGVDIQMIR